MRKVRIGNRNHRLSRVALYVGWLVASDGGRWPQVTAMRFRGAGAGTGGGEGGRVQSESTPDGAVDRHRARESPSDEQLSWRTSANSTKVTVGLFCLERDLAELNHSQRIE